MVIINDYYFFQERSFFQRKSLSAAIMSQARDVLRTQVGGNSGTDKMAMQWNLYNENGKILLKAHKFHHLPGM